MRTGLEMRAETLLRGLLLVLLVLVSSCWCACAVYAQGMPANQSMSIDDISGGMPGAPATEEGAEGIDEDELPMIDMSSFTEQAKQKQQAEAARQKAIEEKEAEKEEAYRLDKLYEVTSIKAITELVKENELILHIDTRPEVVAPINLQSAEARLQKLLILFFVAVLLVVVLFYVLSTLYLLKISREAGKLRMNTLDMHTNAAWLEECERDAQKVRHYDEAWDKIEDDLYQNSPY